MDAQQLAAGKAQYDQWAAKKQASQVAGKAQYDQWAEKKQASQVAAKSQYDQWVAANPRVSPKLPPIYGAPGGGSNSKPASPQGSPGTPTAGGLPWGYGLPNTDPNPEMETVRIPQNGGAVIITRPKQKPADNPLAALGNVQGALGSSTPGANALSYRSGINVGGGVGKGGILSGLTETGTQADPNVAAFTKATAWNDQSQIGRGIDSMNQQIQMDQQAKRSESTTQGASNLAQIYGDHAERGNSQIGLAASIMANNLGFAAGIYNRGRGR